MNDSTGREVKLQLRNIRKEFDGVTAVVDSNLHLNHGEFLSLLGPSGCGKSTTLAIIAGFMEPTAGEIFIDGQPVNHIPVQKRRIGLVFQDYAIFTRLTVRKNLLFGLEAQRVPRAERHNIVDEFAEKLELKGLMAARGSELNMSEMQRVALARVLVTRPQLLLLDEPMSNLDAALRSSLRRELKRIQQDLEQSVLYVTHDQVEAMSMSDRIAVMNEGEIVQTGSPREVYLHPQTRFVAEFIGDPPINMLDCSVSRTDLGLQVSTEPQTDMILQDIGASPGNYLLAIRAHHIRSAHESFAGAIRAVVKLVENFGAEHVIHVTYGRQMLTVMVPPGFAREGDAIFVSLDLERAHLVEPAGGRVFGSGERNQLG